RPPPLSTLFPYTTLFRSQEEIESLVHARRIPARVVREPVEVALGRVAVYVRDDRRLGGTDLERGLEECVETLARPTEHQDGTRGDRKSTRLNSSHVSISY